MVRKPIRVMVLYNQVGPDEYEQLRQKPPPQLDFEPVYDLNVATVEEEIQAIVAALTQRGYEAHKVNIEDEFDRLVAALKLIRPDVVFNLVEFFNDDAWQEPFVAGVLELLQLPYTGNSPIALALCQRKALTKEILRPLGIPTPRFRLIAEEPFPEMRGLSYPMIVKPSREDASSGIEPKSVVQNRKALEAQVRKVMHDYAQPVLVEEYIEGRELSVSILGGEPPRVLPILEMDFSRMPEHLPKITSYQAKWDPHNVAFHRAHPICPAPLRDSLARRIRETALHAYQALKCRSYARVDIRLDRRRRAYVLEVNPNPDLTEGVDFMLAAETGGLAFEETLDLIVKNALVRHREKIERFEDEEELVASAPPAATEPGPEGPAPDHAGAPGEEPQRSPDAESAIEPSSPEPAGALHEDSANAPAESKA